MKFKKTQNMRRFSKINKQYQLCSKYNTSKLAGTPTIDFNVLNDNAETLYKTFKESKWIYMSGGEQLKYILQCKKDTTTLLNELGHFYNYQVIMNDMEESEKNTRLKLEGLNMELDNILKRQFKIYHN